MKKLTPVLMVDDIKKSIEFYTNILGFSVVMTAPPAGEPFFAILKSDNVEVMLQARSSFAKEWPEVKDKPLDGTFVLYIDVPDVHALYKKVQENKINFVIDMHDTCYGTQEFGIKDNSGYLIIFAGGGH